MSETDSAQYAVNPDVSCREEGPDGVLLFNPDTDQVLVLNSTGLLIWQALAQPRTLAQVAARLTEQCDDVPSDQVHQDVHEFVSHLLDKGFVGICGGPIP